MKPSNVQSVNFALSIIEGNVRFQRGLSLVELMISITLGLVILASLSTLFVNQTKARVELDKSNRMIDNGRYAMDLLVNDLQLAGFFGEFVPPVTACTNVPDGIWGADTGTAAKISPSPYADIPVASIASGSDMFAIRRVSTETPTAADAAVNGVKYLQVSHCQYDARSYIISTVKTDFTLREKTCIATSATPHTYVRRMLEHVYFISPDNQAGDGIPTLKMLETDVATGLPAIRPLAEGIEYMQIEYGVDLNNSFVLTATTTDAGLVLTDLSADPVSAKVKQGMAIYGETPPVAPATTPTVNIPVGYTVDTVTPASPPLLSWGAYLLPVPPATYTNGTVTTLKAAGSNDMVAASAVPLTIPYLKATITPGSAVLTNLSADPKLALARAGLDICGTAIPAGTTIANVNTTTITLTKPATQCNPTNATLPCTIPLNIPAIVVSPKALPGDGVADAFTAAPSSASWANVVSVKITLLARNTEESKGYTDTKTYTLGRDSAGNVQTVGPFNDHYKRHVFTQFVRLTNMAGRRE